jgi:hypothetical protein
MARYVRRKALKETARRRRKRKRGDRERGGEFGV